MPFTIDLQGQLGVYCIFGGPSRRPSGFRKITQLALEFTFLNFHMEISDATAF